MITRVKICGLKTAGTMQVALDAGADLVGLAFFAKSPRHVTLAEAARLAEMASDQMAEVVALTVDADDELLDQIVETVRPHLLQLHGKETPERTADIRMRFGTPVMKAIGVADVADAAQAISYGGAADLILFDAKPPKGGVLPGGNGVAFDWKVLDGVKNQVPWMLSGGLHPGNVAEAIRLTGATAVDVSSGVESAPGEKSADKIRDFIRAAKGRGTGTV